MGRWHETEVQLHSLTCGYSVVPAPYFEDCFFPLNVLGIFFESKLITDVWVISELTALFY